MGYRIVIIDEDDETLKRNEQVEDSEVINQIMEILDEGVIEKHDECETVCDAVNDMLIEAGKDADGDHDTIMSYLEEMKLVEKESEYK